MLDQLDMTIWQRKSNVDHLRIMVWLKLCTLLLSIQSMSGLLPWEVQDNTGCYGNTAGDFLEPACNQTIPSVMAVRKLFAVAKTQSTGCPHTATFGDRNETKCCTFAEQDDCKMNYTSDFSFYSECTGLESCKKKVAWRNTECNHTVYLDRANYMLMEFYCIPTSLILNAMTSEHNTTSGRAVYLQNPGYPSTSVIGGSCSVSSSCNTTIVITGIHLNLNNGGTCSQYIEVTDGNTNYTIGCSNNNNDDFVITDVYTSTSHFLLLSFINDNTVDQGQLWIQIIGFNPNATMDLRCGSSAVPPVVDQCPVSPDESTTGPTGTSLTSTVGSSTDTVTTNIPNAKPSTGNSGDSSLVTIIVVIGAVMILAVVIAIIVIIFWKKKQNGNKIGDSSNSKDTSVYNKEGVKHTPYRDQPEIDARDIPEYNKDGLPEYIYGGEPVVVVQILPHQTKLLTTPGGVTHTVINGDVTHTRQPRLLSALKPFDQVQKLPPSGRPLPEVRGAGQYAAGTSAFHPFSPQPAGGEAATAGQEYGTVVVSESGKRKKKKKKRKTDLTDVGESKKKKKKRKKKKHDETNPIEKEGTEDGKYV